MSDDTLRINVHADSDGSEDEYAQSVANALERAFKNVAPTLAREFSKAFNRAASGASGFDDAFTNITNQAERVDAEFRDIVDRLADLRRGATAVGGAFGEAFDPDNLAQITSTLEQVIRLQAEIIKNPGSSPAALQAARDLTNLARSELTATRTLVQQTTLAQREANQQAESAQQRASRERIANQRAEQSRLVVQTQAASARELAILRTNAAEQVAITRASAQQRAAAYELVGRVARSTERVIRSAFDGTSNVVSSAFSSIRRAAQTTTTNVRQSFSTSNQAISQNVRNTNQQISNSYQSSWRRNTQTVNNELNAQESRIRQFSREATEEISSLGVGRVAGFAALGIAAGRALRSGFERAATIEDADRALTQLLGSAEQAKALRDEILDVVTGTPFKLDQFAGAAAQLVAFNVEATKIPVLLETIANSAAVRGGDATETIDRLVRTFGQITAAGRVMTEDLNQLTEAGVPALRILGNAFGKTGVEMREMVEDGAVPANEAIDILINGIQNGTDGVNGMTVAFDGLAKGLGGTLRGSVGNFNTAIARLGANLIGKFQPLLVQMVQGATAAVDAIGKALGYLADSVSSSPVFRLIARGFDGMGERIKAASDTIAPALKFIADGLVTFGTAAAGLAGIRRLPLLLNAITFAIGRLLTPLNLLVAAGVLVSGFITRMVQGSPILARSLEALGAAAQYAFAPIERLATVALDALGGVVDSLILPAVDTLSSTIEAVLVPAIGKLSSFLITTVEPAMRRFGNFVVDDVVPAVGRFLVRAVELGRTAFENFTEFVRDEVVPVVGPILQKAVELGTSAFRTAYQFLSNDFAPFVKNNLIPVLGTLAATIAAFSIGGLPLAGLAAIGGSVAIALTNDDIRNRIVSFFTGIVADVRAKFSEMIDGGLVGDVIKGVLKLAHEIGRVLGDALSDRRLLTAAAGIGAAAVALAASFVTGFARGIIENLPELISLISDGLVAGLTEAWKNPALFAGLIAVFTGGALFLAIRRAGRKAGEAFNQSLALGPRRGGAGSLGDFGTALFGGAGGISKSLEAEMKKTQAVAQRESLRLQSIIRAGSGNQANFQARGAGGRMTATLDTARIAAEYDKMAASMSRAQLAGAQVAGGIGQISNAFKRGKPFMDNFVGGLTSIGTGLRNIAPQVGQAAGIAVGGAFAASFVSKALFDINSSGIDRLQSGIGLAATSIATGAAIGGPAGAAAGVAVAGVGLLTSAFQANSEKARQAKAAAQEYSDAILQAGDDSVAAASNIDQVFLGNIGEASADVQDALIAIGFSYSDFAAAVRDGTVATEFEGVTQNIQGAIYALQQGQPVGGFIAQMDAAGVSVNDIYETLKFLQGEIKTFGTGSETAARQAGIAALGAKEDVSALAREYREMESGVRFGAAAAETFRTKLDELNQVKIDAARTQVNDAKGALDEARNAADRAKDALIGFLTGNNEELSLSQVTNEAIVNISSIGSSIESSLAGAAESGATTLAATIATKVQEAKDEAGRILSTGEFTTQAEAATALQPLKDAAGEVGGEAGAAITTAIDEVLANFNSAEGQKLVTDFLDTEQAIADAQAGLDSAESYLNFRVRLDPNGVPTLVAEAEAMAIEVNAAYAGQLNSPQSRNEVATAGRDLSKAGSDAAGGAPSLSAWSSVGRDLAGGMKAGIEGAAGSVARAAVNMALAAKTSMEIELGIESPSKVTKIIGTYFGEGLAEGITDSTSKVLTASVRLANTALKGLSATGVSAAKAIGRGLAEQGPSFISSIGSAMDAAFDEAMTKAQQFSAVGSAIASNMFANQGRTAAGGKPGGGGFAVALERAYLSILGVASRFQESLNTQVGKFGGFGLTFDRGLATGRENREAFLEAGTDIREYLQTLLDAGRPLEGAVGEAKAYRDQLLAVAKATGQPISVFNEMIRQLGLADDQLAAFVKGVNTTAKATAAATDAERARIAAEKIAEQNKKAAEEKAKTEDKDRTQSLPPQAFRDLIVQTPSGDPEAVALYVVNRVASRIRK